MLDELRRAPLLARLEPHQLERVARHARRIRLAAGQWLFQQGDPAECFYLLLAGQIRLFRLSTEGGEKVIELVGPGQTFAEALMCLNAPRYPVCAAALVDSELIAIESADFRAMLGESVETCFVLLGTLSQRLRALIGEIDALSLHTATSRLARYLALRLLPGTDTLELPVRKAVLASRLSIQPETFSRVIKSLVDQAIIRVDGHRVQVRDRRALFALAELADLLDPEASMLGLPVLHST
ncbi:Crp/Fnr family transcriptional regulator [Caldichromatium japonicum]|uniref:Crp/Fnr family transcriptional regulator n=1 Tax=Caldichromatium japonicum TaxID=2699430 RepID=A0A6G7VCQ4_9GAMM|nr:Crp/Fnr family transcriptional regulator [Caldichromatium japonicum]QIK37801.1 Crp/Fnr family transcriptional regulator [Caldichromatium japonicum]